MFLYHWGILIIQINNNNNIVYIAESLLIYQGQAMFAGNILPANLGLTRVISASIST